MTATKLSDSQYRVEGNDEDDFINVRVGSAFLDSDTRLIASIKTIPSPHFKFCYEVTMRARPIMGAGRPDRLPA
jgi:hypothetical protein